MEVSLRFHKVFNRKVCHYLPYSQLFLRHWILKATVFYKASVSEPQKTRRDHCFRWRWYLFPRVISKEGSRLPNSTLHNSNITKINKTEVNFMCYVITSKISFFQSVMDECRPLKVTIRPVFSITGSIEINTCFVDACHC